MGFSEETVQSNVRNTWYIREKENTWICVALYCSSIRTTISPPPFGGRDTKGEHTLARPVLVLSVWVTVPTAGRVFSFFQCQSCCCALRCMLWAQGLPRHSLTTAMCLVRLLQPKHVQLFPQHLLLCAEAATS